MQVRAVRRRRSGDARLDILLSRIASHLRAWCARLWIEGIRYVRMARSPIGFECRRRQGAEAFGFAARRDGAAHHGVDMGTMPRLLVGGGARGPGRWRSGCARRRPRRCDARVRRGIVDRRGRGAGRRRAGGCRWRYDGRLGFPGRGRRYGGRRLDRTRRRPIGCRRVSGRGRSRRGRYGRGLSRCALARRGLLHHGARRARQGRQLLKAHGRVERGRRAVGERLRLG